MGGIGRSIRRALTAGAVLAVAATAQTAAANDVEALRAEAQAVADEITAMGERLGELEEERREIRDEMDEANAEIAELELAQAETDDVYEDALERFEARAVETYKGGSSAQLSLLLSAETLTQLETVAHAMEEAAALDQETLDALVEAKARAEEAEADLEDRRYELVAAAERTEALAQDVQETVAERDRVLAELNDEIAALEKEARREAREAAREAAEKAEQAVLEEAPELGEVPRTPPNTTWGVHSPDRLVGTGPTAGIPEMFATTGVSFEGEASWYGPGFEGNTTANGDIFDSRLYTVASKTLPFGTYLYVTANGRGVVVYVNDRGPYVGDRILDLSHAAAQSIGISGVGWVRAEIIVKR
ncbi:MAG: septal ring lytic transglycosylase RlpA family protein [Actinomycetota bacterium]|nr:septal ring lytic transglycosylase RlpA family protein [Actinomycetota bacterium]